MSEHQTEKTVEETAETVAAAATSQTAYNANALEGFDMAVPEAFRSAAEQVVTRSREAYEFTKDAMEDTVEMLEKSIDQAGQGAAAINRKVIDITQANLNSGFDLAKDIAGAKNVADIIQVQTAFARRQMEAFAQQAEEMRTLSAKVASDAAEPFKAHVARSIETLKVS